MAQALRGLAETHKARGSLPNAKTCLEKSIAAFEKGGALGHLDYGAAVASIADVISQQGDDAKADKLFVRAIMIMSANTVSTTLREEEQQVPQQDTTAQEEIISVFDARSQRNSDLHPSSPKSPKSPKSPQSERGSQIVSPGESEKPQQRVHPELAQTLNNHAETLLLLGRKKDAREAFRAAMKYATWS